MKRSAPLHRSDGIAKASVPAPRTKKCKACREPFVALRPLQSACSPACAHALAAKVREKRERAENAARREKLKTRRDYIREAQQAVNKYVRLRDFGLPCISCGATPEQKRGGTMDAGHFRSVGSAPHARFYTLNIHAQCSRCNQHLGGNAVEYRRGIVARLGLAKVEAIEAMQGSPKWSIDYLMRLKKIALKKARRTEKRLKERL
jgi:hypothetical protein